MFESPSKNLDVAVEINYIIDKLYELKKRLK